MIDPVEELECARVAALYTGSEPPAGELHLSAARAAETADAIAARNADLPSLAHSSRGAG